MKMKCCKYGPLGRIHNSSFSWELKNEPNKLECYIILGWKGLPVVNSLSY
jgi:hypothetical protein